MALFNIEFIDTHGETAWVKEYIDEDTPIGVSYDRDVQGAAEYDDAVSADVELYTVIKNKLLADGMVKDDIGGNVNQVPPKN